MHGHRLVEVEVAAQRVEIEPVFEHPHALEHVGLLDEARAQDSVPRPMMRDRTLGRIEGVGRSKFLVEETVLLEEHATFGIEGEMDPFGHIGPRGSLGDLVERHGGQQPIGLIGVETTSGVDGLGGIAERPLRHQIRVPVVVDVVFVLVRAGHPEHDPRLLVFRERHSLGPEPGDRDEDIEATLQQVTGVAGRADVVEDGEGDCAVAVDLLERDLPLVVALFTVDRDHRVERCPSDKPQLPRVLDGLVELTVAVVQQVLRDLRLGGREVERETERFGVPIGHSAVLLAGEALRSDVQVGIDTGEGRMQLEDAEPQPLLHVVVAADLDIAELPLALPRVVMGLAERRVARSDCVVEQVIDLGRNLLRIDGARRQVRCEFDHLDGLQRVDRDLVGRGHRRRRVLHLGFARNADTVDGDEVIGTGSHDETGLLRLEHDESATARHRGGHRVPEPRLVVRVFVGDVTIDTDRESDDRRIVDDRDAIANGCEVGVGHADELQRLDFDGSPVGQRGSERPLELAGPQMQGPPIAVDPGRREVERLAVDVDVDRCPVGRVQDFREVVRVAVLPPTHAGRIGVVDAGQVVALE